MQGSRGSRLGSVRGLTSTMLRSGSINLGDFTWKGILSYQKETLMLLRKRRSD